MKWKRKKLKVYPFNPYDFDYNYDTDFILPDDTMNKESHPMEFKIGKMKKTRTSVKNIPNKKTKT
jgi:hypothetical protein